MPWDDKDNHNKKEENKMESPWGSNKNKNNNEFDQYIKNLQQKFGNSFDFKNNNSIILVLALVVSVWLISGVYKVEQEEQAVVLRFGKYIRLANPGLNYHLPEPIERIIKLPVTRAIKEEIGFRSGLGMESASSQRSFQRNIPEESLMLTGDENIVDVNFTVQWNIKNIEDYVFNVDSPRETVKSAAQSAMREVIGNTSIAAMIDERDTMAGLVKPLLQDILDSYKAGILISNFSIQKADYPEQVIDVFKDVQTARADKEREINQAQAYQNDIIPRARGEAAKITQDAEAYKQEVVAIASGEVSRFSSIFQQYKLAKDVTRKRLYLETMEQIMPGLEKVIVDKGVEKNMVPYMALPQLKNKTE